MVNVNDAYAFLGVHPAADDGEIMAARRRAALTVHPDRGGSNEAMALVNEAFSTVMRERHNFRQTQEKLNGGPDARRVASIWRDAPSFVIDVLPVEAFEYLEIAAQELGDIVDSDPPYVLDVLMRVDSLGIRQSAASDSARWCRLELFPDAGSSTVNLTCESEPTFDLDIEKYRDIWVAAINAIGDLHDC